MSLLRLADMVKQIDQIAHRQKAELFRDIALERPQVAAEENTL